MTALVFDDADAADDLVTRLTTGPPTFHETVDDAATVRWSPTASRPRMLRRAELASDTPLSEAFWSLVLGLTFQVPLLGAAVAGVAGATDGPLAGTGIDSHFMNRLRDMLTPGRSALLVFGPGGAGRLAPRANAVQTDVVSVKISERQTSILREVFVP